jgi:diguanylate cyclase (GGDEF)-like protein
LVGNARSVKTLAARLTAATSGTARVWAFAAVLAALTIALWQWLPSASPVTAPFTIPWWLLAAAFFIAEANVIHLHIGRSAHSFSMSEIPLVAGLVLVAPPEFVLARLVGSGLALYFARQQRSVKLGFNLAQFGISSIVAVAVVRAFALADPGFGPVLWAGVLVATLAENLVGVVAVSTAISLAEGRSMLERLPQMLKIGVIVSITNASLALMGLTVLWTNPASVWLFVVPIGTAAIAYRSYIAQRQQHERIELLYESTRILQRNPRLEGAITALLEHLRRMFRADIAEICLIPRRDGDDILRSRIGPGTATELMHAIGPSLDDPLLVEAIAERKARLIDRSSGDPEGAEGARRRSLLVAPLLGESTVVGTILVADRLSEISEFDLDDLKLFETLANHTAVALENGQLEQSVERLSQLKEELHYQASHDALTGLENRSVFAQSVGLRLESPQADGTIPVVLFIDLDDFKVINDTLGHAAGDRLLVAVGDRLRSVMRATDLAARLGGDEFAALLWDTPDLTGSLRVAERLAVAMNPPFELGGDSVTVRASIGVAGGRPGLDTAGDLLRNADVAMYSAKARGKGRVVVFEPSMHEAVLAHAALSADLERAITNREFVLQYQPIVELATGRMTGVEALVRWTHPTRGVIGPGEFILLAEESDAILDIGRWVLGEACAMAREWRALDNSRTFTVSVNVSARQLGQQSFVEDVMRTVADAGAEPRAIVLEMTETALLHDSAATRLKLGQLRAAGIGISVDDFGTGYSSLSYLQRFPVSTLKIARDFVDLDRDNQDAWQFASAIIALADALHLSVIAEGVETPAQLRRLTELGCGYAQGFYFARPLDALAVTSLLVHGRSFQKLALPAVPRKRAPVVRRRVPRHEPRSAVRPATSG